MNKKLRVAIALITCTALLSACGTSGGNEKEYNKLQGKYEKISDDYDSLKESNDELEEKYNELKKKYDELQYDYDELTGSSQSDEVQEDNEQQGSTDEFVTEAAPDNYADYGKIAYEQLSRTPDDYTGKTIQFTGEVVQLMENTSEGINEIRLAVNGDYDKIMYIAYEQSIMSERIIENDDITIYGWYYGIYQYESTMGQVISVPSAYANHIEINK